MDRDRAKTPKRLQTRALILNTALDIFTERGYEAPTMRGSPSGPAWRWAMPVASADDFGDNPVRKLFRIAWRRKAVSLSPRVRICPALQNTGSVGGELCHTLTGGKMGILVLLEVRTSSTLGRPTTRTDTVVDVIYRTRGGDLRRVLYRQLERTVRLIT